MNILQRYILRELAGPILVSVLFFTFLMLLHQLFEMAEFLLAAQVSWAMFFEILGVIAVTLVFVTIPMAVLLGVLVGIGRLVNDNEVLAMRVAGVSLFRLFYPLFILSFLGAGVLMYCGFYVLPGMVRGLFERQEELQFEMLTALEPGRNYDNFSPEGAELFLYFDRTGEPQADDGPYTLRMEGVAMRVVGEAGELTGADVADERFLPQEGVFQEAGEQETLFFAREGILRGNLQDYTLSVTLLDGTIIPLNRMIYEYNREENTETPLYRENPERHVSVGFETMEKVLRPERRSEASDRIEPQIYTIDELRQFAAEEPDMPFWRDEGRGRIHGPWKIYTAAESEIFSRITLPLALPAFVLLAVPLALELRPRAKSVAFLISLSLITVYYVLFTFAGNLGAKNSPLALPAYMFPNLLLGGIGVVLFWRVEKQ